MSEPLLDVRDLHQRYGSIPALNGVSFFVETGEVFGLLGPNGAGKTTLLSILAGLIAPTSGRVTLGGLLLSPNDPAAKRRLGLAPQDLALYGELTARENLTFFGELYGLGEAELRRRVEEVLAAVGLTDRADQRASTFSGGMKRRLNLGAAIVHGPDLLFLDEPTTGVDPQSRNHVFESVRRLNAAGMTVVYTSHYMEEVQALCRRVAILDAGRLIACNTLDNLLRSHGGRIRFRVQMPTDTLRERLRGIAGVTVTEPKSGRFEVTCPEVTPALIRLMAVLGEDSADIINLTTEEPNLERVFLDLTGRELRD